MKKHITIAIILVVILMICIGCSSTSSDEKLVTHAKIRYFDGTMDTLEVDRWFASASGTVTVHTTEGRKVVIGANNIILIEETEEQYNH